MELEKPWQMQLKSITDLKTVFEYSKYYSVTAITTKIGTSKENLQFNTLEQIIAQDALNSTGNVQSVYLTFVVQNTNTETDSLTTENASVGGVGADRRKTDEKQPARLDKN